MCFLKEGPQGRYIELHLCNISLYGYMDFKCINVVNNNTLLFTIVFLEKINTFNFLIGL